MYPELWLITQIHPDIVFTHKHQEVYSINNTLLFKNGWKQHEHLVCLFISFFKKREIFLSWPNVWSGWTAAALLPSVPFVVVLEYIYVSCENWSCFIFHEEGTTFLSSFKFRKWVESLVLMSTSNKLKCIWFQSSGYIYEKMLVL